MSLKIFNTLSGKKENFFPLMESEAGINVSGVTVYDWSPN
jgi:cysteinyl-tRNA synthetase